MCCLAKERDEKVLLQLSATINNTFIVNCCVSSFNMKRVHVLTTCECEPVEKRKKKREKNVGHDITLVSSFDRQIFYTVFFKL